MTLQQIKLLWMNVLIGLVITSSGHFIWSVSACVGSKVHSLDRPEHVRLVASSLLFESKWIQQFESTLQMHQDEEVSVFLKAIGQKLLKKLPQHLSKEQWPQTLQFFVFRQAHLKWQNYGLPPDRIYLSLEMLQHVQYENEVAAIIAMQLSHLLKKHLEIDRQEVQSPKGFVLGGLRIFPFSKSVNREAIQLAIPILYQSGYDVRGLVSVFSLLKKYLNFSPYSLDDLNEFIKYSRIKIALYPPVRYPIIRSQLFQTFRKRIQRL